ncbi:hypothetical protein E8E13_008560 [Curvularia kusanoi]|uniref:Major facilitator superfamily (MFS) profile domain-containing protein n=1 Tax=Curvularia kusanoi TaxID=90978 RepID=A0A9P4TIL0_CURKU|nr:hypothetical protein E8E13_008560 [Curvularia kusanoi]
MTTITTAPTNTTRNSATPFLPPQPYIAPSDIEDFERGMTLGQCLNRYPKAMLWSILLSLTLVMEGYSTILVPNLFSLDPFLQKFGQKQSDGDYEISAEWQSALVNGAFGGQIIGLFLGGWLAEKKGYRQTLLIALTATSFFITITFFAGTKSVLLMGQCLLGAPWGVFQTISTVYASDVLPVRLRGYLTTYVNACWVIGQLFAATVLRAKVHDLTKWAWLTPFGLQWAFPIPIFVAVVMAPESPWWLVRQSNLKKAKDSLRRLRRQTEDESDADFEAGTMALLKQIQLTNEVEKQAQTGTRYVDCFKGIDRRRTEITCMCWIIQILCGSTLMGFSTYFYEQAGLNAKYAYTLSLVQFALGLLGVFASWFLISYIGRRAIYLSGQAILFLCVILIGILATIQYERQDTSSTGKAPRDATTTSQSKNAIPWVIAGFLLVFTAVYDATIGPLCYTLVSEIPTTRLRSKTIVLARSCYNIAGIITNVITPKMLNPTAWNWGAKAGYFWAGTALIGVIWSWWRLPETKGRTFAQIDLLFRDQTDARYFKDSRLIPNESERGLSTNGRP